MGLSNLGIFHTAVGIIAIVAALVSFVKYAKINLADPSGKVYFYGTIITSLTALGLSKHGGFNAGHVFSLFILVLVVIAFFLYSKRGQHNKARYFENFLLSFSFLLSLIPTVNETLTRVPFGKPLAKDASDPLIGKILLTLLVLFLVGSIYQFIRQRESNKKSLGI
jgi:membrane-associated HD superfamily phosphohydrolase